MRSGEVERLSEKAEKKAGMISSISRHGGRQMPLADPLVAASLVDDNACMERFECLCNPGHDDKGKPTFEMQPTSSVCAFVTTCTANREQLYATAIKVLGRALSPEFASRSYPPPVSSET